MILYVAARYQDKAQALAALLEANGHIVNARWIKDPAFGTKDRAPDVKRGQAEGDLEDISVADALVLMTQPANETNRGGRHVEYGFALALGKRVFVLGEPENVFHYLSAAAVVADGAALLEALKAKP